MVERLYGPTTKSEKEPSMADSSTTFRSLVTSFADFLTVAIHTILYERQIYPRTSFLSARKYNFAVRQNRHPKVCEWISDAVTAVECELLKGTMERVVVVLYTTTSRPVERYVVDVSRLPMVPPGEVDTPLERTTTDGEDAPVLPLIDLEEQLRATMSRLIASASGLKPLPEGCTFTIAMDLRDGEEPPVRHPQLWIPVQPAQQKGSIESSDRIMTPVRAVAAGEMIFETWIEEAGQDDEAM